MLQWLVHSWTALVQHHESPMRSQQLAALPCTTHTHLRLLDFISEHASHAT